MRARTSSFLTDSDWLPVIITTPNVTWGLNVGDFDQFSDFKPNQKLVLRYFEWV